MMLDSPMIDVAIGLVFFYVTLSLVCSSIQEIIASVLGLRSRNLRRGIRNLVGNEYAQALYDHPLIKGLRKPKRLPSYVNPEIFGAALIEVVARDQGGKHAFELTAAELRETIAKIDPRNPARGLLLSLADRADAQVGQLVLALAFQPAGPRARCERPARAAFVKTVRDGARFAISPRFHCS